MKKTTFFFSFLFLLNCLLASSVSACVVATNSATTIQTGTPQYKSPKMGKLRTAIAQKMVKRFAAARTATDIDKSASVSVILGIAGIATFVLCLGLLFYLPSSATLTALGVFFLGLPLSLLLSIIALVKSSSVRKNADATQNQKEKAQKGRLLGWVGVGLFAAIAALFLSFVR
jgi:hypothetical protein